MLLGVLCLLSACLTIFAAWEKKPVYAADFGFTGMGKISSATKQPSPEMWVTDGPGMVNTNAWKHGVLDGGWITPKGDLALEIQGFDFKIGIYKPGEPDNFRWHEDRFYFDGGQNSPKREVRFDLLLSDDPCIKDAEGKVLATLEKMWHEKKSIFMELKYPNAERSVIRELRRPKDIVE